MSLVDRLVAAILAHIREQRLLPGDKLPPERKLAEVLGASRSSLREAIRILASQGVLRAQQGGGTYVDAGISDCDDLTRRKLVEALDPLVSGDPAYRYDVLEARHVLEGGTAWHAALRASDADKTRIRSCFDDIVYFQSQQDGERSSRADASFHLAIAAASHNAVLLQMMRGMFELVQASVTENRQRIFEVSQTHEQLTGQHRLLMEAIFRGDAEAARNAVWAHLEFVDARVRALDEDEARRARTSRLTHFPV